MLAVHENFDNRLTKRNVRKLNKKRVATPEDGGSVHNGGGGTVIPPISPRRYKVYTFDGTLSKNGKKVQFDDTGSSEQSKASKPRQKRGPGSDGSATSSEKMSWVTYGSPLWRKDKVPTTIKPLPDIDVQKKLEKGFVNDAVSTFMYHSARRRPIIPPYNAEHDRYAQAYFQSPIAKAVLERSMERVLVVKNAEAKRMQKINKLSFRRRAKESPSVERIREREKEFLNDAIITEKLRTKYKDIIPKYDAAMDKNCRGYFERPDVKRLLNVTCYNK
ncbi:uncharacterized protein [Argopecten irradians]|uniref:uncharacterized protein n=1 Tax=Argopecten irradians TaxID=31199 RepID=UPI00370FF876